MQPILEIKSISKSYAGVQALSNIDVSFFRGKVHAIVGENGAGKSTLIQIITGAVTPDEGSIRFDGNDVSQITPAKSRQLGIAPVYQELNLIPELKVYENIFLGKELKNRVFLDVASMKKRSREILAKLNSTIDVDQKISSLGIGSRQIVEIAKALLDEPKLILLDEPTASLTVSESEFLHEVIHSLAEQNIAVIFVSHKLDEVLKISDTITVLRDGVLIETKHKDANWMNIYDIPTLVDKMLGRKIFSSIPSDHQTETPDSIVLQLENLSSNKVTDINLSLAKGEILSISGLLGSMRTELFNAIFSIDAINAGKIFANGKLVQFLHPIDAIQSGIGFITEDRKDSGLFMELSILENMSICSYNHANPLQFLDQKNERERIVSILEKLNVKYSSLNQKVKELSGGNQQKIAIGKWLIANPNIILLDEPTRGVDVGAKEEIYKIMFSLVKSGQSILMVSSDTEEILRLSDRTAVMRKGKIVAQYAQENISTKNIYGME